MDVNDLEYRMYGLVPYNLSPIQQGIQFGHALQEYNNLMMYVANHEDTYETEMIDNFRAFKKWAEEDKTFIILNGGTTNNDNTSKFYGTMNQHQDTLLREKILYKNFFEPDLGDQVTGIVFLVDERVWNREKYPDHDPDPTGTMTRKLLSEGNNIVPAIHLIPETMEAYEERLGGKKNVFLRQFLRQFKLA